MEELLQIKQYAFIVMYYIKKLSLIVFVVGAFNSNFNAFKYFSFKSLKYVPFSLSILSYCGLCIIVMSKINMYLAPSSFIFFLGFLSGTWFIAMPIRYTEQLAFHNTTYRTLFSKKYIFTKIIISISCLIYLETVFPLTTILACKNSIISYVAPSIFVVMNTYAVNFCILFTLISIIYLCTLKMRNTFNSILVVASLTMVFSLSFFVKPVNIINNLFMNTSYELIPNVLSYIDGLIMSSLGSDVFSFLSIVVSQDFNTRIKNLTYEEKRFAYATYSISIAAMTTIVFTYTSVGTLSNAMVNIFNQVDSEICVTNIYTIVSYIYKVSSVISMITIIYVLYRESITVLKIMDFNRIINIITVTMFLLAQSFVALNFSYEEVSLIGACFYLMIQIIIGMLFITRKKDNDIENKIKIQD